MHQPPLPILRVSAPKLSARVSTELVASTVARLIACGEGESQSDLVRITGLARTTVANGLDVLKQCGVIRLGGLRPTPGRGRPADRLEIDPHFGVILVAELEVSRAKIRIHDLAQRELAASEIPIDPGSGPLLALSSISAELERLFAGLPGGHGPAQVLVIGLPAPLDHERGVVIKSEQLPDWDGFPVADVLTDRLGCPTVVENDVNLKALGEARALSVDQGPLIYIDFGAVIGAGLVTKTGELHRGADGAAGDIGHIRVFGADHALCECGSIGCLEAVASLPALLRIRQSMCDDDGSAPINMDRFEFDIGHREEVATKLVRQAAGMVGEVVISLVHFFNPARVVIGGRMARASDEVLASVRSAVYCRAGSVAARSLTVSHPALGESSGIAGGLVLGIEAALDAVTLRAVRPAFGVAQREARGTAPRYRKQTMGAHNSQPACSDSVGAIVDHIDARSRSDLMKRRVGAPARCSEPVEVTLTRPPSEHSKKPGHASTGRS